MPKLKYTFTVVHEDKVTKEELKDYGEIMELGRPATMEEYKEYQEDLMADDGAEYLDAWICNNNVKCKVEIV